MGKRPVSAVSVGHGEDCGFYSGQDGESFGGA